MHGDGAAEQRKGKKLKKGKRGDANADSRDVAKPKSESVRFFEQALSKKPVLHFHNWRVVKKFGSTLHVGKASSVTIPENSRSSLATSEARDRVYKVTYEEDGTFEEYSASELAQYLHAASTVGLRGPE
jgi:hypothetical protein